MIDNVNQPLVSIITNTLNRADLIHRCIESIQRQTYQNYEHIIVDGNSQDNTEEVVKQYNDPHIKYIKLNMKGPSVQLRAGADAASGKYITFLDDDDEYLPEKLQKQVQLFESLSEEFGVVYCWMSYYNNDNPDKVIRVHKTELRGFVGDIAPSEPLVCGTPTMMIRRDIFNQYGRTFNDNIGIIGADWELMARICQYCKVDYVPESLVKVYVNHGHARLTTDFYEEKARRSIIFHNHFLIEFKDVFNRHPENAWYQYASLSICYRKLNDIKNCLKYYRKFLACHPSAKNLIIMTLRIILKH